ncbi:cyclin-dependent kinase 2-associated protein 2 [Cryptotermes secundus]|nr:cyclin-dependent kinase 2-associated protein 2 [Cryptotermes secundus]
MMMDDDIQAVDSPMTSSPATMMSPSDVMSPGSVPGAVGSPAASFPRQHLQQQQSQSGPPGPPGQSKYAQLLAVIEEMGKDIRPTYAGSKSSAERLKRGIVHARILVRECLMETERSARQ